MKEQRELVNWILVTKTSKSKNVAEEESVKKEEEPEEKQLRMRKEEYHKELLLSK